MILQNLSHTENVKFSKNNLETKAPHIEIVTAADELFSRPTSTYKFSSCPWSSISLKHAFAIALRHRSPF